MAQRAHHEAGPGDWGSTGESDSDPATDIFREGGESDLRVQDDCKSMWGMRSD